MWGGGPYPPRTIVEVSRLNQDDIVEVEGTFYAPATGSADRRSIRGARPQARGGRDAHERRSADAATGDAEVPVLIAGGGLIGLSTAMFLAQHGIRSLAIERLRGGSPLPRAGHFHLRTIELFRSAGIEDEVRAQSEKDFVPEGAIIAMDSLSGRKLADIIPGLNVGVDDTLTPIRRMFINQPSLERILRKRADEVGATVRDGCELVGFAQDADGVTVTVRDVDTGGTRAVSARATWSAPTARTARCASCSAFRSTGAASSPTA